MGKKMMKMDDSILCLYPDITYSFCIRIEKFINFDLRALLDNTMTWRVYS